MNETLIAPHPNARNTDPETSHVAARSFSQVILDRVRLLLEEEPEGLTDDELAVRYELAFGLTHHQESPAKRRSDLVRQGLVVKTPLRRMSRYGRPQIVWRIVTEKA